MGLAALVLIPSQSTSLGQETGKQSMTSASGRVGGRAGRTEQAPRQVRYTLGRRTAQAPPPAMIAFLLGPERLIALGLLRGSQCAIEPLLGPVCLRSPYVYISYIYEYN
eukprot:g4425.t1